MLLRAPGWREGLGWSIKIATDFSWVGAAVEAAGALQYLKKHFKLVILSNVDNETFQASNRRLQVEFDAVYTAEDIGSYKPSARNFDYMIEKLEGIGVKKERILHTAESMFHDHKPANDHGLKSCWIHRRHARQGFGATVIRVRCRTSISSSTICRNW